jgi:hypothetical protein
LFHWTLSSSGLESQGFEGLGFGRKVTPPDAVSVVQFLDLGGAITKEIEEVGFSRDMLLRVSGEPPDWMGKRTFREILRGRCRR